MKRTIYIISWIVLGILLSFIIHAIFEIFYIKFAYSQGIILKNKIFFGYGYCVLPIWLKTFLFIFGILMGYLSGKYFWRVVYIEKRHNKIKIK